MTIEWLIQHKEKPVQIRPTNEIINLWESKACAWSTGHLIEQRHVRLVNKAVRPFKNY